MGISDDDFARLVIRAENGEYITDAERVALNEKLDDQVCCSGFQCGCYGASIRDEYEHYAKRNRPEAYARYVENGHKF